MTGILRSLTHPALPNANLVFPLPAWYFLQIMTDVTRILCAIEQGDPRAAGQLLPLVYEELRKLAAAKMSQEAPGQTLQATALVHEAYLRLVGQSPDLHWDGRGHFFASAAEAMRRILIERARHKRSHKAGGGRIRIELSKVEQEIAGPHEDLLALDEALEQLAVKDKRKADLVKLRFFAGLTNEQAADVLGISTSTADNDWAYARSWLRVAIANLPG
jgi:RNA polymerase sigma factor (TIGR02999 family)